MEIIALTSIVAGLFLVVGISEPLADRLRLPFSVILALVGILIGTGSGLFLTVDFANSLNFIAENIANLPIPVERLPLYLPADPAVSGHAGHGPAPDDG